MEIPVSHSSIQTDERDSLSVPLVWNVDCLIDQLYGHVCHARMALSKTEKGIERIEGDEYDQGVGDGLISSLMGF